MDKTIDDLLTAEAVTADDLFVVQQNATAKKVSGDTLRKYVGQESGLPKPDGAEEGSFLRVRNKKWVAEKSPVLIDLYAAGVKAAPSLSGTPLSFEVSADIGTQLVAAAKNGGALLKFGFNYGMQTLQVQAYFVGVVVASLNGYQFSGKAFFDSLGFNIFFDVTPSTSKTTISAYCTIDSQLPDPEEAENGAFLRVENGKWVTSNVPAAEGGTF